MAQGLSSPSNLYERVGLSITVLFVNQFPREALFIFFAYQNRALLNVT